MDLTELNANARTKTGNGPCRVLRRNRRIPAVLYGPDTESVMLSVDSKDLENIFKNKAWRQLTLNLLIADGDNIVKKTAMIKELQSDPLSRDIMHLDFYEISMERKILVKVPITTKGKAKGIELGGMLQVIRREVEVLCLPLNIPEYIEIDVTDLDIGESVHIKEVSLGSDIEIITDVNFTVLTILTPKKEEEEVEEDEEEVEETEEEGTGDDGGAKK